MVYSFKNGSLTRQRIMKEAAQGSWDLFETLLSCSPVGNDGFTAMYFDDEEITPKARGIHRFDGQDRPLDRFEQPATEVRALVEGQFLAKRVHAEKLGFRTGTFDFIHRLFHHGLLFNFACILCQGRRAEYSPLEEPPLIKQCCRFWPTSSAPMYLLRLLRICSDFKLFLICR